MDIDGAVIILNKIKTEDIITVSFTKKDGSERIMKCTLNFSKIPEEHKPKGTSIESILSLIRKNILRVYDIENQGWRSIPIDNIKIIGGH